MNENNKTALIAINKWFYYAMNYRVVEVEVNDWQGKRTEMLPDCFNAFSPSLRGHLSEKWSALYDRYGSHAVLMVFYGELDTQNRIALMEWVMDNYNDEQKLRFNQPE